jgi:hypothetical protein
MWKQGTLGPLFAALLCVGSLARPVSAATADEKAAAEVLFDDGRAALKKGDYVTAAEKLEASQKIDPGVGTLLYLGECYEKMNRTASAWATFREAESVAAARGDDRARVARDRAERLATKLSKLTISFAQPSDLSIEAVKVERDGVEVNRGLWGSPIPMDPGNHEIVVSAPGYETAKYPVDVAPGGALVAVSIAALVPLPKVEEPPPAPKAAEPVAAEPAPPPPVLPQDPGKGQRTAGFVVGGAGLLSLAAGGVFGGLALSQNQKALNTLGCDTSSCPTAEGTQATRQALTFATVSDITFIAGGALAALGIVLVVSAPPPTSSVGSVGRLQVEPLVSAGFVGASAKGQFSW